MTAPGWWGRRFAVDKRESVARVTSQSDQPTEVGHNSRGGRREGQRGTRSSGQVGKRPTKGGCGGKSS